jgi:hypothetical protein
VVESVAPKKLKLFLSDITRRDPMGMFLLRNCRAKLGVLNEFLSQESPSTPPRAGREGVSSVCNAYRLMVCDPC